MKRSRSIRRRVERLEPVFQRRLPSTGRSGLIEIGAFEGERHLVMTSDPASRSCRFVEMPGAGPQLADFGEFSLVLYLTEDEMKF